MHTTANTLSYGRSAVVYLGNGWHVVYNGSCLLFHCRCDHRWISSELFPIEKRFVSQSFVSTYSSIKFSLSPHEERTPLVQRIASDEDIISSEPNPIPDQPSATFKLFNRISKVGLTFEAIVRSAFRRYGTICARKPFIYLLPILGIALSLILSVGTLTHFQTMTDPVSLWSSTNSRARLEKNFFDENFGPFYRTEQIIIRPTNQTTIIHNPSSDNMTFGPAFEKEFLLRVLTLQNLITKITANVKGKQVVLTDICFAPMQNNLCAIQTPLGWFQSDDHNLNRSTPSPSYLDHIKNCALAPLTQKDDGYFGVSCAGQYGGPMLPNVVLADYENDNYFSAKAISITILLNNHINSEDNERALKWESNYLNFMHGYSDPYMEIIYYSEVCAANSNIIILLIFKFEYYFSSSAQSKTSWTVRANRVSLPYLSVI